MRIISIIYDQILKEFLNDLKLSGLSPNSIRFYKSDLSAFASWFSHEVRKTGILANDFKDLLPFLKPSAAESYKKDLIKDSAPTITINRKLSTLRRFSSFLYSHELLSFDFAGSLQNIPAAVSKKTASFQIIVEDFKKHLEKNKAAKNTVKNYLADIRHFLNWVNSQPLTINH